MLLMAEPQPIPNEPENPFPRPFYVTDPQGISMFVREIPGLYDSVLTAPGAFEQANGVPPDRVSLELEPDPEGDTTLSLLFDFSGTPEQANDLCDQMNRHWTLQLPDTVGRKISLGIRFK